jgi:hypothetical protein
VPSFDFLLAKVRLSHDSATRSLTGLGRSPPRASSSGTSTATETSSRRRTDDDDDDVDTDDSAESLAAASSSSSPPTSLQHHDSGNSSNSSNSNAGTSGGNSEASDGVEIVLDSSTTLDELISHVLNALRLPDTLRSECALSLVSADGRPFRLLDARLKPFDEHKRADGANLGAFFYVLHARSATDITPRARRRVRKQHRPRKGSHLVLAAAAAATTTTTTTTTSVNADASSSADSELSTSGSRRLSRPAYRAPLPGETPSVAASTTATVSTNTSTAASSTSSTSTSDFVLPAMPPLNHRNRSSTVVDAPPIAVTGLLPLRSRPLTRASARVPSVVAAPPPTSPRIARARSFSDLFKHSWDFTLWSLAERVTPTPAATPPRTPSKSATTQRRLSRLTVTIDSNLAAALQSQFSESMAEAAGDSDVADHEVVLGDRGALRGGSFEALFDMLAGDQATDTAFIDTFCLVVARMSTAGTLLEMLHRRYADGGGDSTDSMKALIRLRAINVLKRWLLADAQVFVDERISALANRFVEQIDAERDGLAHDADWRAYLHDLMRDAIAVHEASLTGLFVDDHDYPTPLMPSNVKEELGFLDVPPLEMARQLCVQHHELFQSITMADLLNPARNRSDAAQPPSIAKLIAKFNRFSFGLAGEVVSTGNIDMRVTVVERVIFLGEHLRALGNFHGVMAVVSALNLGCVQRLKQTWQRVRKSRIEVFNQLSELMASKNNFAAYRRAIGDAQPPVVPFVGVLMNDLVAIEELPERLRRRRLGAQLGQAVVVCRRAAASQEAAGGAVSLRARSHCLRVSRPYAGAARRRAASPEQADRADERARRAGLG